MKCEEKKTRKIFSLSVSFLYLYAKPHNLGILIKRNYQTVQPETGQKTLTNVINLVKVSWHFVVLS